MLSCCGSVLTRILAQIGLAADVPSNPLTANINMDPELLP
jgi:hypothetical protein